MKLEPTVWGPKYWFVLFSVAYTYPLHPNAVAKRKYYDLVQNMPLFLPNPEIGDRFAELLVEYPVQPYLDKRDSFLRWIWFIHNKINKELGKPEISFKESLDTYLSEYLPKPVSLSQTFQTRAALLNLAIICVLIIFIYIAGGVRSK